MIKYYFEFTNIEEIWNFHELAVIRNLGKMKIFQIIFKKEKFIPLIFTELRLYLKNKKLDNFHYIRSQRRIRILLSFRYLRHNINLKYISFQI